MSPETKAYISRNKGILFFFLLWMFRLFFLQQGNRGGVGINKYVLVQIFAELGIFFMLFVHRFNFFIVLTELPLMWFGWLYLLGMASVFWGILPLMGCYFAFQNFIMLAALYFLAQQAKDFFQLERLYIFSHIIILWFFFISCFLQFDSWHSVSYSTISAFLFTYCAAEYDKTNRPPENISSLGWGVFWGIVGLGVTSSAGAMVSVLVSFLFLAMFARKPILRFGAFVCICVVSIAYFSGTYGWLLRLLFPGKSLTSIETAHGRVYLWNLILEKAAERPWLGWGYASVERIISLYTTDAHNAVVGTLGSQGYIGCGILAIALFSTFFFLIRRRVMMGGRGLFVTFVCALVNSNTSNFITSKAGLKTIAFQMIIVLALVYYMKYKETNKGGLNQIPQKKI